MSALQKLDQVLSNPDTRLNPPAMDEMFTREYEEELVGAIKAALASGVPADFVYSKVREVCMNEVGYMDSAYIKACGSIPADTPFNDGASTYFHTMMSTSYPCTLGKLAPPDWDPNDEEPSLHTLLQDATPNKQDHAGNSVLHILVDGFVNSKYWPDDTNPALVFHLSCPSEMYRDDERAEYTLPAFKAMVDRGWSTTLPNSKGINVRHLIAFGMEQQQKSANRLKKQTGWAKKVANNHMNAYAALAEMLQYAEQKGV